VFGQSFADQAEVEIVAWKVEIQGRVPGEQGAYTLRARSGARTAPGAARGSVPRLVR
jgi:hypothetical protein